jgi:integrase/recombinase XerD
MREDLQRRHYSPEPVQTSRRCVAQCAPYCRTSPERRGPEQGRHYPLALVPARHVSWSLGRPTVCALRCCSHVTLGQPHRLADLPPPTRPTTLPPLLRQAAVAALLQAPRRLTTRAILTTLSAAGLRVSALGQRQVTAMARSRLGLCIRQGKGRQARCVLLAPRGLTLLRQYGPQSKLRPWRFPGPTPFPPLSRRTVSPRCRAAGVKAPGRKPMQPPTLRQAVASHGLAAGGEVRRLPLLLGPQSRRPTRRSLPVTPQARATMPSPLEPLPRGPAPEAQP